MPAVCSRSWMSDQLRSPAGIQTGLLFSDDNLDSTSGMLPKGKIEIVLRKSDQFESLMSGSMVPQRAVSAHVRPRGRLLEPVYPSDPPIVSKIMLSEPAWPCLGLPLPEVAWAGLQQQPAQQPIFLGGPTVMLSRKQRLA